MRVYRCVLRSSVLLVPVPRERRVTQRRGKNVALSRGPAFVEGRLYRLSADSTERPAVVVTGGKRQEARWADRRSARRTGTQRGTSLSMRGSEYVVGRLTEGGEPV